MFKNKKRIKIMKIIVEEKLYLVNHQIKFQEDNGLISTYESLLAQRVILNEILHDFERID